MSQIIYSIKQGLKSLLKNKMMNFLSIISVSASLIILGIVLSLVVNINEFVNMTREEVNEIRVSIDSNFDKEVIKKNIETIDNIESIEFKGKEDAFKELKKSWGEDSYLLEGIDNPLDNYYIVTIKDTAKSDEVVEKIRSIEGIVDIEYHEDVMKNFISISNTIKKFGSLLIIFLTFICLILISNTIKSQVYSKKEEIQIIKCVGGSNAFIISPFVVEGFMIGFLGSLIAIGSCIFSYGYIVEKINLLLMSMKTSVMIPIEQLSIFIIPVLLVTGVSIGILGSIISVKKYLKI